MPSRQRMLQRPDTFQLNNESPLARGLVFAGLGMGRGSLTMRDSSALRNNGTKTGGVTWGYSQFLRRAYTSYDGTGGYFAFTNDRVLGSANGLTMSAWFYDPVTPAPDRYLMGRIVSNFTWGLYIVESAQQLTVGMNVGAAWDYSCDYPDLSDVGGLDFCHNKWTHLCGTFDGSNIRICVNGVLRNTVAHTGNLSNGTASDKFAVGARGSGGGQNANFPIADPSVWNRALSLGEIRALADPANVDLRIGNVPLILERPRINSGLYSPLITGTTCWGHVTGVTETNIRTFAGHWTGDATISGSGDSEIITLLPGQSMISETVYTGAQTVELTQNQYIAADTVTVSYRTGATQAACEAAAWTAYTVPFASSGYVQAKIENTL